MGKIVDSEVQKRELFSGAALSFDRASILDPNYRLLEFHLAISKMEWGEATSDPLVAVEKFSEAAVHFQDAVKRLPEMPAIFVWYARMLLSWGKLLNEDGRHSKMREAEDLLKSAFELDSSNAYDLACVKIKLGMIEEARILLDDAKRVGNIPSAALLQDDPDMDPVRRFSWFDGLLH
jgi:thioredoxin-like negative regulator of GroEL